MRDSVSEVFSLIGSPARLFGRLPLITRYLWSGSKSQRRRSAYAKARWGDNFKWRPWLLFDAEDLEVVENLLNWGSDKRVLAFKKNQLGSFHMLSVVGALLAGVALTTLQTLEVAEASYIARGCIMVTLIMSIISTFFTCILQRHYGFLEAPSHIRAWLTNGIRYINSDGCEVFQSSILSHHLLHISFELVCISITSFLAGIGIHLVNALTLSLQLGQEMTGNLGNKGVLITFIITTSFVLILLGQLLAGRDFEHDRCQEFIHAFTMYGKSAQRGENGDKGRHDLRAMQSFQPDPTLPTELYNSTPTNYDLLRKALRDAAAAHRDCAATEAEVSRLYEKIAAAEPASCPTQSISRATTVF